MAFSGLDVVSLGLNSALGGKRQAKVPRLPPINIDAEQNAAIGANQRALPGAEQLGTSVNAFNQAELDRMHELALPGYERIKQNIGENLTALTSGQIPKDVQDAIFRNSAIKAYGGGFAGSGMARNLTARDLGLTSLGLISQGQDSAQRWLQSATAPSFDVSSMFISPSQRIAMRTAERDTQFNRDWMNSQVNSLGTIGQQAARNMISNY